MKIYNLLSLMFILLGVLFLANIIVLPLAVVSVSFGVSNNLNEDVPLTDATASHFVKEPKSALQIRMTRSSQSHAKKR